MLDDQTLVSQEGYAMPMLLALSHVHQLLIREGLRMETSLVTLTGETREVHHVACLLDMVLMQSYLILRNVRLNN